MASFFRLSAVCSPACWRLSAEEWALVQLRAIISAARRRSHSFTANRLSSPRLPAEMFTALKLPQICATRSTPEYRPASLRMEQKGVPLRGRHRTNPPTPKNMNHIANYRIIFPKPCLIGGYECTDCFRLDCLRMSSIFRFTSSPLEPVRLRSAYTQSDPKARQAKQFFVVSFSFSLSGNSRNEWVVIL